LVLFSFFRVVCNRIAAPLLVNELYPTLTRRISYTWSHGI